MRESRASAGRVRRTLSREEIETRLDALIRRRREGPLNKLRDDARAIAAKLGLESEFDELNDLIGALLGTRDAETRSDVGKARAAGHPYDPDRIRLFETLFIALREAIPVPRPAPERSGEGQFVVARRH